MALHDDHASDNAVLRIRHDVYLKEFLKDEFDAKQFASNNLLSKSVAEQLSHLAEGITLLDKQIHTQVTLHHEDLLQQAVSVEAIEGVLDSMRTRIDSLRGSVNRIKSKIVEPYNKIVMRNTQLSRMQTACDILRRVQRILSLSPRLASVEIPPRELIKVATALGEIEWLASGVDWEGIDVIANELANAAKLRAQLRKKGELLLAEGWSAGQAGSMASAMQVLTPLGILKEAVLRLLSEKEEAVAAAARKATDPSIGGSSARAGPGKVTMPSVGHGAQFRAALWGQLDSVAEMIISTANQAHQMRRALASRRESAAMFDGDEVINEFIQRLLARVASEFESAVRASSAVRQAFESEYPKLVRLLENVVHQLKPLVETRADLWTIVAPSMTPLENAFLSRSLSRLLDPIHLLFLNKQPVLADVDGLGRVISTELMIGEMCPSLAAPVARNVAKAVQLFAGKSEMLLEDAYSVAGALTSGHQRNIDLCNALWSLHETTGKASKSTTLPAEARPAIDAALQTLWDLIQGVVDRLLASLAGCVRAILASMHQEDFNVASVDPHSVSLYVRELQDFAGRVRRDFLAPLHCTPVLFARARTLLEELYFCAACHIVLLRPVSAAGKQRLTADSNAIEQALMSLAEGAPAAKVLRAIRVALFQSHDALLASPSVGEALPVSTAMLLLISRASDDLQSPHATCQWTQEKFVTWMLEHNERDRVLLIKVTLENYASAAKNRALTTFDPVYPALVDLLQRALQAHAVAS